MAANGSQGYAPVGFGPELSVVAGGTYPVNFSTADRFSILVGSGGTVGGVSTPSVTWTSPGSVEVLQAVAKVGYVFGGWAGTGVGSYTGPAPNVNVTVGGPVSEAASFLPLSTDRFNLTFLETGLATGTWWSVELGGIGYSSDGSALVVRGLPACGSPGSVLSLSVPYAYDSTNQTRYVPTSSLPSQLCTSGLTTETEVFAPQFFLTLQSTPGGYAEASFGSTRTTTGGWVPLGVTVGLDAISSVGYIFLGWNGTGSGNYTGTSPVETVVVGGPILEVAGFSLPGVPPPPPTYWLQLNEITTLANGTSWTVEVGTAAHTAIGPSLRITGLAPGTYALTVATAYSPDDSTRYSASGDPVSVTISKNTTDTIGFQLAYWFAVSASPGGTFTPASGWLAAGAGVTLSAVADDGYGFVAWSGNGAGSYSGTSPNASVRMGGPIEEVATFGPASGSPGAASATPPLWSTPVGWALFALLGLLIGVVVGAAIWYRRSGPPPPPPEAEPANPIAPEEIYDETVPGTSEAPP